MFLYQSLTIALLVAKICSSLVTAYYYTINIDVFGGGFYYFIKQTEHRGSRFIGYVEVYHQTVRHQSQNKLNVILTQVLSVVFLALQPIVVVFSQPSCRL